MEIKIYKNHRNSVSINVTAIVPYMELNRFDELVVQEHAGTLRMRAATDLDNKTVKITSNNGCNFYLCSYTSPNAKHYIGTWRSVLDGDWFVLTDKISEE